MRHSVLFGIQSALARIIATLAAIGTLVPVMAQDASRPAVEDAAPESRMTVEELARSARESVVVVSHFDRNGEQEGLGAGFVVSEDGLIATSLHVIGEARPVSVELANGRRFDVVGIHAWDRMLDLAIVRIEASDLKPLRLGDSDALRQGARVVAMGNPLGLTRSIVQGVVSARRDFDGVEMIQLAIPIEQGNSGGPLLDLSGRVHGILTMKSMLTANLGFAMPVNALKSLLEKPNPVPMNRWVRIAALNPKEWHSVMGARWTQRGGAVTVQGRGTGFGGRALCLSRHDVPRGAYDVAVTVKLDDESGAAGLAFASDGDQKHYGFYPTAGKLRLTRFEGATVFSWTILAEVSSPHYRMGDWNRLLVRVDGDRIRCYVNGEQVIDTTDNALRGGTVGLAKFRDTHAQFKQFAVATELPVQLFAAEPELAKAVSEFVDGSGGSDDALWRRLVVDGADSRRLFLEKARELEHRAQKLRDTADQLHRESVARELVDVLKSTNDGGGLLAAALLISKLDNPDLELEPYRRQVADMAVELRSELPADADAAARLRRLIEYLFVENGFHGSRTDYYNRANSYMNDVLDTREGLPITLSVLFLELAHQIGLKEVAGAPLPRHFMVKFTPKDGEPQWIDVFDGGAVLSREQLKQRFESTLGEVAEASLAATATHRQIIARMLRNLLGIVGEGQSAAMSLRYLDVMIALEPENVMERLNRARVRLLAGERQGAKADLKVVIDAEPAGVDLDKLMELYRSLP